MSETQSADKPVEGTGRMTVEEATRTLLQERSAPPANARDRTRALPVDEGSPEPEIDEDDRPWQSDDGTSEQDTETESEGDAAGAAEDEPQDDSRDAGTDDPEYEIKVGDKPQRVKLSELQRGYLRQQDYSRKTGELATHRQALGQESTAVREERAAYAVLLKELKSQIDNAGRPAVDLEQLRKIDPVGYLEQKELAREQRAKLDAIASEEQRLGEIRTREQQQMISEIKQQARQVLLEKIPEWRKPAVAKAEVAELTRLAIDHYGYRQEEVDNIIDPRFILVARDALRYRQMRGQTVSGKRVAPQPGRPVPARRSVPNSDPNASRKQAAQSQFNRRPSLHNAVDALIAERGE